MQAPTNPDTAARSAWSALIQAGLNAVARLAAALAEPSPACPPPNPEARTPK